MPIKKLINAKTNPIRDIRKSGFELKPKIPLNAIFSDPKYLLYLLLPDCLSSLSYSTKACL